ncbi:MAG: hypothetical protein R3D80_05240 [Paracoccaceae bacterium]
MWRKRRNTTCTATLTGVAVLCTVLAAGPSAAGEGDARILAAEILVARADLARIADPDLPPLHRDGIVKRVDGALGLIPWLLIVAGDEAAAATVTGWRRDWTGEPGQIAPLDRALETVSQAHPLDLAPFDIGITRAALAEARAIHDEYCAGCHDGLGSGDPDAELASRDLYLMAREEESDRFLARLINGVKGDETIGFVNPLSDAQIAALWKLYTWH